MKDIDLLIQENELLRQRLYALEHALSDLLVACANGSIDKQLHWRACPTESSVRRMLRRHYNILIANLNRNEQHEVLVEEV